MLWLISFSFLKCFGTLVYSAGKAWLWEESLRMWAFLSAAWRYFAPKSQRDLYEALTCCQVNMQKSQDVVQSSNWFSTCTSFLGDFKRSSCSTGLNLEHTKVKSVWNTPSIIFFWENWQFTFTWLQAWESDGSQALGWRSAQLQSFVAVLGWAAKNLRFGGSLRLVLGSGQRPVGGLVAEGMAKKVAGGKGWLSSIAIDATRHRPSTKGPNWQNDKPAGQEKVWDLERCRRWSAGGLGCWAETLRLEWSPGVAVVKMRILERVVEAEACSRNTSFPPGRPTTSEARPTPSRLRTEELPLLEDVFYGPVDFGSMVISTKRISFIYSL